MQMLSIKYIYKKMDVIKKIIPFASHSKQTEQSRQMLSIKYIYKKQDKFAYLK